MAIEKLLVNGSLSEFRSFIVDVGFLRSSWNYCIFESTLRSLGMDWDEIRAFWDAIDVKSCGPGYLTTSTFDTRLSASSGVLLDSRQFPRNLLLYRLFQLKFPGVLTVVIKTVQHTGTVLGGRWEFAGPGTKKVAKKVSSVIRRSMVRQRSVNRR